jgi:hypothetical protein
VSGVAFVTRDPEVRAAIRAERAAVDAWRQRLNAALAEMPLVRHDRLWLTNGVFGAPELYALQPVDPAKIPEGWRVLKGKRGAPDRIEPRRGQPGLDAREWLAEHQPPKGERLIVADFGAPTSSSKPSGDGRELITLVKVLLTDDAVHLLYDSEPGGCVWSRGPEMPDDRWTREPLSSWHLALEAHEAAGASS